MKKKLLITGASGFLGYHLIRLAAQNWEVYGIVHTKDLSFEKAVSINCDITNYIELGNYFDAIMPDAVIHTAAISDANFCQTNRSLSYAINVEATKNLAGICSDYHIPFAFTSTDLVFDGKRGMYKEYNEKNPVSVYGEQKSIAEDEALKIYPEAAVFRLPLLFGFPKATNVNYIQKFITQLNYKEIAKLFTDEYRSVCGAKSIAIGIMQLIEHYSGVIHLAGKERISRYDFGKMIADIFSLDTTLIQSVSQKDVKMSAPRPADVSFDISKAIGLGFIPMNVREELKLIADHNYL